ncbi:hypothetical protein [Williamsoniiplasma lucivorax]|uniref:Uncharacterized protein n=1 Tax=Williamsoniiplasma lucivorax TaxID=209274 RepID=A0A2S5RDV1_9MOLU|nr:hypothetical protein [Williamsoniiplasma lucivorax]PPE05493.1 hypothetical protein ELUCI_v1c05860 [Williamsoniiplasma lucivorax]
MEKHDFWKITIKKEIVSLTKKIVYWVDVLILACFGIILPILLFIFGDKVKAPTGILIICLSSFFLIYSLQRLTQLFLGRKIIKKISSKIINNKFVDWKKTRSYLFVLSNEYKNINYNIQKIIKSNDFCKTKNEETVKFVNIKYLSFDFFGLLILIILFISQLLIKENFWHWQLILSIVILNVYIIFCLPFLIIRQIVLNNKIKNYYLSQTNKEQYPPTNKWLFLDKIKEKIIEIR